VMGRGLNTTRGALQRNERSCGLSALPAGWRLEAEPHGSLLLELAIAPTFVPTRPPTPLWRLHHPEHRACAVAWSGIRAEPVTVYVVVPKLPPVSLSASSWDEGLARASAEIAARL